MPIDSRLSDDYRRLSRAILTSLVEAVGSGNVGRVDTKNGTD